MKKTSILILVLFSSFLLASCSGSVVVDFSTVPDAPSNLTATASDGAVNLSWNSVTGATYKVHQAETSFSGDVADYGDLSGYTVHSATETSIEISRLTNGKTYYFVVTALKDGKESLASNMVTRLPDFPILLAPTNLRATPSSGTVSLSWNSVAGATYKLHQAETSFSGDVADYEDLLNYTLYSVTTTSRKIIGLTNGTSYYFVVTAIKDGKESLASNEAIGLPDFPIPLAPTNLTVTASDGAVNLSWNSVAGATYKVHQAETSFSGDVADYGDLLNYTLYSITTTTRKITGLTNGTSYYFVVTAIKDGKESLASNEAIGLPDFPILLAPTNLRATASDGAVNLSWNSVTGATYKVHQAEQTFGGGDVADYGDLSGYTVHSATETSIEISRLTNGKTYYFVVTALKDGKESLASNMVTGLPDFPILLAPTNLRATPSSGTVSLSWNSVAGATYKLHQAETSFSGDVADYGDLSGYTVHSATETSIEISRLTNGKTYYFVVTALKDGKESLASNMVTGLPDFPILLAPTNLRATPSSGTVNLSWNSVTGATYKVHQAEQTFGGGDVADYGDLSGYTVHSATETSIEISRLTNGKTYYFVVTALKDGKESLASNMVTGLPDFPILLAPTNLRATPSSGTVSLSWNSVAGATYKLHQAETSFSGDVADYEDLLNYTLYSVTTTSRKIIGLTNGTSYYFVVTAFKDGKESTASNVVIGLPDFPIPLAPTNLTVTASDGAVNLSWNSVAGATYKVHQAETSFSGDVADYGYLLNYTLYSITTTSRKITGLTNGTSYYFVVTAIKDGKESPASNEAIGLPDFPVPSTPTKLRATASDGAVNLSWDRVAGATYRVHQAEETFGDGDVADYGDLLNYTLYSITATSRKITGLTNGTSYYFVVTAIKDGKESPVSNEAIGLPDFPVPSTPTNLTASASSGTVSLNWTGSEGVHYYKVYQSTGTIIADDLSSYISYNVTANTKKITGLTNNTTYYFVVTAVIGDKESPASDEVIGLPEFPQPSTPTNLRATASSGTVNLSWTGSAGAHYYKVYQSTGTIIAADLSSYSSYNVTITSKEIPGLANGTTYYFVVRAVIADKESGISNEVSGLPEENLIAPPTNLMETASGGAVTLNWTGREGATYKVHQAEETFGVVAIADYGTLTGYIPYDVTETSTKITGLVNGRSYYFVVTALVGSKESGASNEVTGDPDFPIPSTPTNLEVTASSGTVNLSWDSVAGATYKVYQSTTSIANDLSAHISYDVTETSTKITRLTNGTRYYFVVTALANGKESPASNEVSGFPDFPIPSTPTGLEVTNVSSVTVSLSWNSVAGATYRVYRSTASIANDLSGSIFRDATTNSIEITGLRNGTSYYFVVTALANGKESPASNEVDGLPDFPIPSTPTGLEVTSVSSGTVNLRWNSVAGVSYKVYQSTGSIGDDLSSYTSYNVSERSIEITELRNGTRYYFVVTALANGKESLTSDEVDGLPDFPIPSTPTGLEVTNVSSGTVNLSWDSVAGATYRVYYQSTPINDDVALSFFDDATTSSTEITDLTNGTRYYFVVTALANGKESPASNEVNGLPDFPIPSTPTGLEVTSVSSGTVNLSWNSVAGASYKVYQSTGPIGDDLSSYTSYNVMVTSKEITGLTNGTRYYFIVTALENGKESLASDEVNGLPDFPIPPAPTSLTVTSVSSSGTVNLSWDSVAGAIYKVYQAEETFGVVAVANYGTLVGYQSYETTASSREISNLTNGTRYYFVVTALANGKESPASNEVSGLPEEHNSVAIVSFTAWMSSTGTEVTFPKNINENYEFYRSRDKNCDLDNYSLCSQGQKDLISNSLNVIVDTALTLENSAYYVLKSQTSISEVAVSTEQFSVRAGHEVIVFNNKMYLIGGTDGNRKNDVWGSTDGAVWTKETSSAAFSARSSHQVIVFNNKMYLIGGYDGNRKNDVWSSTDGVVWTEETSSAAFSGRTAHQVIVFNNKMYLIGGYDGSYKNDVWSSTDGVNWTEETSRAVFSAREHHQVIVFNNKMYLIGGYDDSYKNDVWSSTNGVVWTEETSSATFSARSRHQVTVFNNKIYLIGGYNNDVWSSTDGVNWTEETSGAAFSARYYHQVIVFNNKMYLIGGGYDGIYKNDIWSSTDGVVWIQKTLSAAFSVRHSHRIIIFNNKIYLIGGSADNPKNDVWSSTDGVNWTEETSRAAFFGRTGHQVIVFNNKMYLIGGSEDSYKNDVWSSTDSVVWTEETSSTAFSARENHQVVVFNNKMYLIGGHNGNRKNDIWSSTDGINWTEETSTAAFSARSRHQVIVLNNKMYLIGGYGFDGNRKNDVWSSTDGVVWTQETLSAAFSARYYHQVIALNNRMYLIGGYDGNRKNDVWSSTDGINWIEETSSATFSARSRHQVIVLNNKMYLMGGYDGSNNNDIWNSTDGVNWRLGIAGSFSFE